MSEKGDFAYRIEPSESERPIAGDYLAQAFIINAPRLAETESNVVQLKK